MKRIFEVNTICRLCLRVDEKAYRINNTHLKAFIESIIKLKQLHYAPTDEIHVCFICNALLTKTFNFMQTIWNAQEIICIILKCTDKITESMIESIDRRNKGLNPVTLSSNNCPVIICDNVEYGSCDDENASTKIKEVDLNLIDKIEGHSKKKQKFKNNRNMKKKQKYKNNCNINKNEILSMVSLISSSDEDNKLDESNLYEVEVEVEDIKTEDGDQLTKYFNTDAHDDPKPESKKKDIPKPESKKKDIPKPEPKKKDIPKPEPKKKDIPKPEPKKKDIPKKITKYKKRSRPVILRDSTSSEKEEKCKKKKQIDDDYQPDSSSHSEDSDYDLYDDEGKLSRRPINNRVYPRKCDHKQESREAGLRRHKMQEGSNENTNTFTECDYEVQKCIEHFRHYLWEHPNVEYPYKLERNYTCSICGKMFTKEKIHIHEDSHVTRKLKCTLCPKVYSNKLKLYEHKQRVHPKKTYTCDYCSKIFKTRVDITRHIRIHTGSKPFKCHICGDAFAHSGNRSIHIRSKHQNKRYVPKKCKGAQKVRRNKKHDSTDTEITSNKKKIKRRTKKKSTKKCT